MTEGCVLILMGLFVITNRIVLVLVLILGSTYSVVAGAVSTYTKLYGISVVDFECSGAWFIRNGNYYAAVIESLSAGDAYEVVIMSTVVKLLLLDSFIQLLSLSLSSISTITTTTLLPPFLAA